MRDGSEQDVFTSWRRLYCYLKRAGACAWVKRKYNRRVRRKAKLELRREC